MNSVLELLFVGIGNTLAGDDGVGPVMLSNLREALGDVGGMGYHMIHGDLYQLWDLLPRTRTLVLLDALAGDDPGLVVRGKPAVRGFAPSFHQTDAAAVMRKLETLYEGVFPLWTLWGVTIACPDRLGEGLSEPVDEGARIAVSDIVKALAADGLAVGDAVLALGERGGSPCITRLPDRPPDPS